MDMKIKFQASHWLKILTCIKDIYNVNQTIAFLSNMQK